jgi:hypothetical protein
MSEIVYTPPAVSGPSGSGSAGQVTFWSAATVLSGSNNLFFDTVNNRLGIGTTTPTDRLDVNGTTFLRGQTQINGDVALNGNRLYIGSLFGNTVIRPVSTTNLQIFNSNGGAVLYLDANGAVQIGQSTGTNWALFSASGTTIYGTTNTNFFANGNVSINQAVDTGYKFHVNGTAYLNNTVYLGNARVGFSQTVPYFDIVASFTGGAGFSIGFVDNNNTNRWATWKYTGSAMSDYTSTPTPVNSSVQFQLDSISRGFLLARMTDAQILAISSPAEGIQVWSTDQKVIAFYDGSQWNKINHSPL